MTTSPSYSAGPLTFTAPTGAPAVRFHRFAPRPLAYADPRSASPLPPFARGRRFLEHVEALTVPAWDAVHVQVVASTELRHAADQHLFSMFVTPARVLARDAVAREARRVCICALQTGRIGSSQIAELTPAVTTAALALILRDLLPPELFVQAYGPFADTVVAARPV